MDVTHDCAAATEAKTAKRATTLNCILAVGFVWVVYVVEEVGIVWIGMVKGSVSSLGLETVYKRV